MYPSETEFNFYCFCWGLWMFRLVFAHLKLWPPQFSCAQLNHPISIAQYTSALLCALFSFPSCFAESVCSATTFIHVFLQKVEPVLFINCPHQ